MSKCSLKVIKRVIFALNYLKIVSGDPKESLPNIINSHSHSEASKATNHKIVIFHCDRASSYSKHLAFIEAFLHWNGSRRSIAGSVLAN